MNKTACIGIIVSADNNLMWMVFNEKKAIAFDATSVHVLEKALKVQFIGETGFDENNRKNVMNSSDLPGSPPIYTEQQIMEMEETHDRELLGVFTTHHHLDHSHGDSYWRTQEIDVFNFSKLAQMNPENENSVIQEGISVEIVIHKRRSNCLDGLPGTLCRSKEKPSNCTERNLHKDLCCTEEKKGVIEFKTMNIALDDFQISCLGTPCHTKDSVCFLVNQKWIFLGDTIFFLGCGKFFEGVGSDMNKNFEMLRSVLEDDIFCCYGHDYSKKGYLFAQKYQKEKIDHLKKRRLLTWKEETDFNVFMNAHEFGRGVEEMREIKNRF